VEIGSDQARNGNEAVPGQFLCLTVVDTGCGMTSEVLSHIFEPFFTTKPVGKGTGLGLATVYGIAKQHGGWVEAQSQPGQGSTFRIYIPICKEQSEIVPVPSVPQSVSGGSETVLVVEDEKELLHYVVGVLSSFGYQTITAESATEALDCWSRHQEKIDVLLTDMMMPGGLTGRQLAERMTSERPSLKVVYTSGYSPGLAGKDIAVLQNHHFLAKPYRPTDLLNIMRVCLDEQPQAGRKLAAAVN
jgi:CheY-like chemotaxis protein